MKIEKPGVGQPLLGPAKNIFKQEERNMFHENNPGENQEKMYSLKIFSLVISDSLFTLPVCTVSWSVTRTGE